MNAESAVPSADTASADATVNQLNLSIVQLLPLLTITADSVRSTASITSAASGSTTLTNPAVGGSLGAGLSISANPLPNTVLINTAGIHVVLNEQIATGAGSDSVTLTVNAIHVTLTNVVLTGIGTITGEIIVSQSRATIDRHPQLEISMSALPAAVAAGGSVDYTITLINRGTATAHLTRVTDTLPTGFSFVPNSTGGTLGAGAPAISGTTLTWSTAVDIPVGATRTLSFQALSGGTPGVFTSSISADGSNFFGVSIPATAPVTVEAKGEIAGTVTDRTSSAPLANASVQLVDGNGNVLSTTTTSTSGSYNFPAVSAGTYTLAFSASGYLSSSAGATVTAGATTTVDQALAPRSGSISGVIPDQVTQAPLSGVNVTLTQGNITRTPTTDTAGGYAFANVASGVSSTISAATPNYTPATLPPLTLSAGQAVTQVIRLVPLPGTISGSVTDSITGAALPSTAIQLIDASGNIAASATTDAEGRYAFSSVVEGNYSISFARSGYLSLTEVKSVAPNAQVVVDARLVPRAGSVSGVITDAVKHLPIAGASVTLTINGVASTVVTNSAGDYAFANAPATTAASIVASAANYSSSTPISFSIGAAATITHDIALVPLTGSISGQVTDQNSRAALFGVMVTLMDQGGNVLLTTTTDASGAYSLLGLAEGDYRVRFSKATYLSATGMVSVAPNSAAVLNQALVPESGSVSGIVRDALTGNPISGASVVLTQGTVSTTSLTNAAGEFDFANVKSGLVSTLAVSHPNYAPSTPATFTLTAGGSLIRSIDLQPLPGTISGTITDRATGAPLAGATLQLRNASGNIVATTASDSAGRFTFSDIAEGDYTLVASATAYVSVTDLVKLPPNGSVTLTLSLVPAAGSVSGTIRDAVTGAPIAGATVTITSGSASSNTITDGAGEYSFSNLASQQAATITASHPDFVSATLSLTISPSGSASQNLQLQPKPSTITGKITALATGAPIAGAAIELHNGSGQLIARTTSDGSGQYSLSNVAESSEPYRLDAAAAGYITGSASIMVGANQSLVRDLPLAQQTASVTGTVTDFVSGAPIAGATVTLIQGAASRTTQTNPSGQFVFNDIPTASDAKITVEKDGYKSTVIGPFTIPAAGSAQTLTLEPLAGSISGTITDQTSGIPLSGISVQLVDAAGNIVTATTSDSSGAFRFTNVIEGNYSLVFTDSRYATRRRTVSVGPNDTATANVALVPRAGSVVGMVTDAVTRLPIAGAVVTMTQGTASVTATTDTTGAYAFANAASGVPTSISAAHPHYASADWPSFTVSPTEPSTINLQLSPKPSSISGTITGAGGTPLAGASVTLLDANKNVVASRTTDANGHYSFAGVTEGSYTIAASKSGYISLNDVVSVGPNAAIVLDMALTPQAGSVSGFITDAVTGSPIAGAAVTLFQDGASSSATTNAAGEFVFAGVKPGVSSKLSASHRLYAQVTSPLFTVAPGGSSLQNMIMEPHSGTIRGTVTDAVSKGPIAGASVQLIDARGVVVATRSTDANGSYEFTNVIEGSYSIVITAPDQLGTTAEISVAANSNVITTHALVPSAGSISGVITDRLTGKPIGGALVTLSHGSINTTTTTDAAGEYAFAGVAAGTTATIRAEHSDYEAAASDAFTMPAGGSSVRNLELQPKPGIVTGMVTNSAGMPISGATVELLDARGNVVASTTTVNGSYSFNNVAAGSYTVVVSAPNYVTTRLAVSVQPNATAVANEQLTARDGALTGVVIDTVTGAPISGATVTLTQGSNEQTTTTNSAGEFAFSSVRPELAASLTATHVDYQPSAPTTVTMPIGDTTPQSLRLQPKPGSIYGIVSDRTSPIAGCRVQLIDAKGNVVATTVTDASGAYRFANVTEGTYSLTFTTAGYGMRTAAAEVGPNREVVVSQALTPERGSLRGVVTDAVTRQPVPGATVRLLNASGLIIAMTTSDINGNYALPDIPEGSYVLSVTKDGYETSSTNVTVSANRETTANTTLGANAARPATVKGVLTDDVTGRPIAGATVTLVQGSQVRTVTTDGNGAYLFLDVAAGTGMIKVLAPDYADARSSPFSISAGMLLIVDLQMSPSRPGEPRPGPDRLGPAAAGCINREPLLSVPQSIIITAGNTLRFRAVALDPDGESVTYSAAAVPAGATFDAASGLFTYTPANVCDAEFVVTIIATDARGASSSRPVRIRVPRAPRRRAVSPATGRSPIISTPYSPIVLSAGDSTVFRVAAESDCPVTLAATGPAFAHFDPATGEARLAPGYGEPSALSAVTFTATDCGGRSATSVVTIAVVAASSGQRGALYVPLTELTMNANDRLSVPISNIGAGDLRIDSIDFAGSNDFELAGASGLPAILPAGRTLEVAVRSAAEGSGALRIVSSDSQLSIPIHVVSNRRQTRPASMSVRCSACRNGK